MIKENTVVSLNYILKENNSEGTVLENTIDSKPLEFIFGKTNMMPAFENKISGLKANDKFSFSVESSEAYGDINPQAIIDLDINIFKSNGEIDYNIIKVGNLIPMQDSNGGRMNGLIIEMNDSKVKMDFNHPLAGKDLFFEGEIISTREATEEELNSINSGCCGGEKHTEEGDCNNGGCGCGC